MIEQQIRPWNVLEIQTLSALKEVRREDFVPEEYRNLAFTDCQIPIEGGEFMLEPKLAARMVESLGLHSDHRVLQIGTGTGYVTALVATLCQHVTSVEINEVLHNQATVNLGMAGFENIQLVHDDCFHFRDNTAGENQYDAVLVTGSVASLDGMFSGLIGGNGCIVGIEGNNPAMQVVHIDGSQRKRSLFDTVVPRLHNAEDTPIFEF